MLYLQKYKKQVIIIGAALISVIILFMFFGQASVPVAEEKQVVTTPAEKTETAVPETKTILVDIKGEVHKPGVYQLAKDARVQDIVHLAGGVTKSADSKQVNLAAKLKDEESIYIAKVGEQPTAEQTSESTTAAVNINTATLQELQAIPGVGPAKALAIIEYRESTGLFQSPDDLKNISGFGEKTIERLKSLIVVK